MKFPEGAKVTGYRCMTPDMSDFADTEHDATCVCNDDVCDWSVEMPVCTAGENTDGYTWTMNRSGHFNKIQYHVELDH